MTTGKTIALTRWTFVNKVMSVLFNMLSRMVMTFLPKHKYFLIHGCSHYPQWFWSPQNKVWHCFHCFSIYFPWSDGTRCPDLSFLNVEHIKKQRHYFVNKGPSSQGYGFSSGHVCMWELDYKESWAPKNWCWRSLLRVPCTARRSNQSILKISPGCSLEGLMLRLKLQYFGHLMRRADSFEKALMLGKIEGMRRRGPQRIKWLDGITDSTDMGLGGLWQLVMDREPGMLWFMGSQRVRHDWATELNWIQYKIKQKLIIMNYQLMVLWICYL